MTEHDYMKLIQPYEDACKTLQNKLCALNHMLYGDSQVKPIHNIYSRIKEKSSIELKLLRKQKETTVIDAKKYLQDIAGIRVITYFIDDIYSLVATLKQQHDIKIIEEIDYIENPKENGYRSYHVVIEVPVYQLNKLEYVPVEVQLRTLSMDFWACMEHRILYKKEGILSDAEYKEKILASYAEQLFGIERQMKRLNDTTNSQMNKEEI